MNIRKLLIKFLKFFAKASTSQLLIYKKDCSAGIEK